MKYFALIALLCIHLSCFSQERFQEINTQLKTITQDYPGLEGKVELNVSGISIQDLVRGIAETHGLNIAIDGRLNEVVVNNFSNATVRDVLVFLCKKFDLDIEMIGSIISIKKYTPPPIEPKVYQREKSDVAYVPATDFISMNLRNDTLDFVAMDITMASAHNVVLSPEAKGKTVSAFIQNRPFDNAMEKFCYANNLTITKTGDNFYLIDVAKKETQQANNNRSQNSRGGNGNRQTSGNFEFTLESDRISLMASAASISEIIETVSTDWSKNYFMYTVPTEKTTCFIENATYEEFLSYLLHASQYTFKLDKGLYLIGQRSLEGLRTTELIQMQFRTIEDVIPSIPEELKKDITIQEFTDLNGIIASGSYIQIHELKEFLKTIDRVVPMVNIEVMIVDVQKSNLLETGVEMGLGEQPTDGGTLTPGVDFNFSSGLVNNLINAFNGFGLINLGSVTPDFYMTIRAMETNGIIEINSTPMLATLNGHEASMSIGSTEYYAETQTNVIAGNNATTVSNQVYKSTNADLKITIKPYVSSDEQVTLEIEVQQADFTGRIAATAPPGSVQRNFQSVVRVRNGEMIMLGGLDKDSKNDTTEGVPLLSRIPILKWFFSRKSKNKEESKLTIFIKPTIIY